MLKLLVLAGLMSQAAASDVVLEQILSREHPDFVGTGSGLAVAQDHVYLYGGKDGRGYVLRVRKDGTERFGGETAYAITGVAANGDGVVATSNAHFSKSVHTYDRRFQSLGHAEGFTGNDAVGWDGPGSVEVGASGDFYGLDQHANRVVRISADGRLVRTYLIRAEGDAERGKLWASGFRVCESRQQFVFLYGAKFVCVGFDGRARWTLPGWNAGNPWDGFRGGFDLDGDGRLYLCEAGKRTVALFDANGKPAGKVDLPGKEIITHLRVSSDEFVVRHKSATELFRRYAIKDGADRGGASIAFERLVVRYPEHVWTAGDETPFAVEFTASGLAKPDLRVWVRPLGEVAFTELPRIGDKARAPQKGGLYHLRVTAGLEGAASEYLVQSVVEVRPANAVGSVSILTPLNRMHFAFGEPITGTVVVRAKPGTKLPETIELRLGDARHTVRLEKGTASFTWPHPVPRGEHRLTTDLPGFTVADQRLVIGKAFQPPAFRLTQHGDYGSAFPEATFFDAPEKVAAQLDQAHRLGINTYVERMGHGAARGYHGVLSGPLRDGELSQRLQNDPLAVSPLKAEFAHPVLQTLAGYGAQGIETRGILLYMDAGLPLGTGFDRRKPAELTKAVADVTARLKDYPSFRGWSWAANWWIEKRGASMAGSPEEKSTYVAALKEANATGKWSTVLDTVSDRWIGHAIEAEKLLRPAAAGKISAMTAPYRQPGIVPPLTFANAEEVDLHWQAEQIQWPRIAGHNVDFYRRPGKPAWAHPELWNDDGAGGHILSHSFELVMRGADGVGQSGSVKGFGPEPSDPRGTGRGMTSIHRTLNHLLADVGQHLAGAERVDPVVIPVSTRMMRLEFDWKGVGGFYFTRLYEAYNACVHAHRPARFVFAEDLNADSFRDAKAVLVVSQTVELEPAWTQALAKCGLPIFTDGSCRAGVVPGAKALGVAFNRVETEHHTLNDDSAFPRFRDVFLAHAKKLRAAWSKDVPPLVECANPEILFTECRAKGGRFLIAVNDTLVPLETGLMWRVGLHTGSRLPVRETVRWNGQDHDVDLRVRSCGVYAARPQELPAELRPLQAKSFGPHLRDVAVSPDGKTAVVTAAGWDRNVYLLDLTDKGTRSQNKVGHHYAVAPRVCGDSVLVEGYDLTTAEGYHLYRLNASGKPERRFASYGVTNRGTSWANPRQWLEPADHFAASPDGSWIASAGDLGLAVWDKDGKLLWSRDDWKTDGPRRRLLAANKDVLISIQGATMTTHRAATGEVIGPPLTLGPTGVITRGIASADGSLIALVSSAEGGRVFIVQDGKLVNSLAVQVDDLAISPDGKTLAVTKGTHLHRYDSLGGLVWSYTGDDILRAPRFSRDGQRIACGSELGTLTVHDVSGKRLLQRDMEAWPVPAWLPDGSLLVVTWNGRVIRLSRDLAVVHAEQLAPDNVITAADLTRPDSTPTARITSATNALAQHLPLMPNLLKETSALVDARFEPRSHGDPRPWQHKIDRLFDGDPAPPESPWLEWSDINYIDSGWRGKLTLHIDTFRTQIRLDAITFVEDPNHPESWLRKCRLEYWDAKTATWRTGPLLLSDQATHSHRLATPIEAARFRIVSAGGGSWPVGNLRLGELVFHGEVLGPSHPDAAQNRPVAVLFDEREDDLKAMIAAPQRPFAFHYADAFSGGKSLAMTKPGETVANWQPPFGHCVPGWDFEIVETPQKPGQYRWLQFAWKRLGPETQGLALGVGPGHTGGWLFTTGAVAKLEGARPVPQGKEPPADWEVVRVDLWKLNHEAKASPYRIRSLTLAAVGGGGLFDQILLGRTEADLPSASASPQKR